jgi:hypothetical protein
MSLYLAVRQVVRFAAVYCSERLGCSESLVCGEELTPRFSWDRLPGTGP